MRGVVAIFLIALLIGCSSSDLWKIDAIASQEPHFDTSRLVYTDPTSHLHLEFLKMGGEIEAFLFLDQYLFAPSSDNPKFTEISFKEPELEWTELCPLREGKMRLKLSKKTAERLTLALQKGRQVAILAGGFQEVVLAEEFKTHYSRFLQGGFDFMNSLKGPIE